MKKTRPHHIFLVLLYWLILLHFLYYLSIYFFSLDHVMTIILYVLVVLSSIFVIIFHSPSVITSAVRGAILYSTRITAWFFFHGPGPMQFIISLCNVERPDNLGEGAIMILRFYADVILTVALGGIAFLCYSDKRERDREQKWKTSKQSEIDNYAEVKKAR